MTQSTAVRVASPSQLFAFPDQLAHAHCSPQSPRIRLTSPTGTLEPEALHQHSGFELIVIEAGKGWLQTASCRIPAQAGDVLLIPPGTSHSSAGLAATRRWMVNFEADVLVLGWTGAEVFAMQPDQLVLFAFQPSQGDVGHLQLPEADHPLWFTRLRQLEQELQEKSFGFAEVARALLIQILIDAARLATLQSTHPAHQPHPLLTQVFHFIERHHCQQISLSDVAKAVSLSPAYLTDFIRRKTGRTVLNWIIEYRMAEARRLLLTTSQSIEQIAAAIGYQDTSHFIRQFRRFNQTTPHAWRLAHAPLQALGS